MAADSKTSVMGREAAEEQGLEPCLCWAAKHHKTWGVNVVFETAKKQNDCN